MHTIESKPIYWQRLSLPAYPMRSSRALLTVALGVFAASAMCTVSGAYAQGKKDDESANPGRSEQPADSAASDSKAESPSSEESADIEVLRQEYLRLRDELFRSRARAAAVASAMYSTRLQIFLNYGSSRFHTVTRATIRLDGGNVFDDASGAIANDAAVRFEGFVAPGRHTISIRIEVTSKDDERFVSTSEHTFTIQAPAGKDVIITAKAQDQGDIAYAWQKKERGTYQPSLSVTVRTENRSPRPKPTSQTSEPLPGKHGEVRVSSGGDRVR